MATKPLPSQEVLRQLLDYDPETGALIWRERGAEWFSGKRPAEVMQKVWNADNAGKPALSSLQNGYRRGRLFGRDAFAHRVIWKLVYGVDADQVDHINGDRSDNRLINLRSVCKSDNNRNSARPSHNTSGQVGVHFDCWSGKWRATIHKDGKCLPLGRFARFEGAVEARKRAEVDHDYHRNHGR